MKMKTLVFLLLSVLMATAAFGYINYPTDTFAIYFDSGNFTEQIYVSPFVPFNAYLVLTNPASATNGFECTVTTSGTAPAFALSTTLNGAGAIDVDASPNGFMVGCSANYPRLNDGCTLVTWQYMLTGPGILQFFINKATIPSLPGGLPVVTGDGVLRRCGVSSGEVTFPCACVNYECRGMPVESSVFGSIKALFR
jgi:hypothetical protein